MANLINANFARMWKSKYFWLSAAATFAAVLGSVIMSLSFNHGSTANWDQVILHYFYVPLFTSAAFAATFLGTEYSDNTVRRKLTVGKTRPQIYLANLVTAAVGGLVITAAGQLAPAAVAIYAGAECFSMSAECFAAGIIVCVCAVIAACALFTLIGMTVAKKSLSVVLTLILMIGAYTVAPRIREKLDVPQVDTITRYGADGQPEAVFEEPNPEAVTGFTRTVLETVYNVLPFGAVEQAREDTRARALLPLYSLGVLAIATTAGVLAFRRKDIK